MSSDTPQCAGARTAADNSTAVHIAVSAARFADRGMPPVAANRCSGGPRQRLLRSHRSKRGELREKQYDAAITKIVAGSPGNITPAIARPTAHQPSAP